MERSAEQQRVVLDAVRRSDAGVPAQARPVGVVTRVYAESELETDSQRTTAAAAGRTAVAEEIEGRWPGIPFVVRSGTGADLGAAVPEAGSGDEVVVGVAYRPV